MASLTRAARRAPASAGWVAGGLLVFLLSQYASAFGVPFINDDYVFLDKTRAARFLDLWRFEDLAFQWYRPWSREFHYWALQRVFGAREVPFHLASLALWLGILMGFWGLARRLAGPRAAAVAAAGVAGLAAWGVPLLWVAGVQELWMLLFAVLTLHAWAAGRRALATAGLAGALLSKETALVLAPIAVAGSILLEGRRPAEALRLALPLLLLTALWALVHPVLGGRLWHPLSGPLEPGVASQGPMALWRAAGVALNVDTLPRPERGWWAAVAPGAVGALALGAVAATGWLEGAARPARPVRPLAWFGAAWALLGWTPLLMPSLGWHAYYALLGCLGVWLAVAAILTRRRGTSVLAMALVMAVAAVRPARAASPSLDWGSEWYQRRAAEFIRVMRAELLAARPRLPAHARLFFVRVPSNVGFIAGDGPALRVWYGEPTLRAGFYSSYRPRGAKDHQGPDYFFRFDSTSGWVEVVAGAEDWAQAREANPRWERDHVALARTLADGGDWARAAAEFVKLAEAAPGRVEYALDAGTCFEALGDSATAAAWYARAAALPGSDPEARRNAERFARLRGRR